MKSIRRFFLILAMSLIWIVASAYTPEIRSIDIDCQLDSLGNAQITEVWDVCVASGTEWYLVRENLGEIEIRNLEVLDGQKPLIFQKGWDVNASGEEKRGKCGLNYTDAGVEICWGVGDYGDHVFTASYVMTNAVKSLNDYDMLHIQFISDELSSYVQHATVRISVHGSYLSTDNSRIWGFGYEGNTSFENGEIVGETTEGLNSSDSMILLTRFDKGVISDPQCVREMDFQYFLDEAMEGADFSEGPQTLVDKIVIGLFLFLGMLVNGAWVFFIPFYIVIDDIVKRKKFLGTLNKRSILWSRDIPFSGDLCTTEYVLSNIGESNKKNSIASAMILQMIRCGAIEVRPGKNSKQVDLALGDKSKLGNLSKAVWDLWNMIDDASGNDHVLQYHEFGKWSSENKQRVSDWVELVEKTGRKGYEEGSWQQSEGNSRESARTEVRKALGFKKFLKDYTLIKERTSKEAPLWSDYLIFGALFGVAEQVAKELKDINPKAFEDMHDFEPQNLGQVIYLSSNLASAITSARSQHIGSSSGGGGRSSSGGGGGFSGGGHGGGSR